MKADCNPGRSFKDQCKVLSYLSSAMVIIAECSKTEPLSGSVPNDSDAVKPLPFDCSHELSPQSYYAVANVLR